MIDSSSSPWLHRFALAIALMTLGLIGLGGMVTSKGVGMAVPDWPTTYGENMFLFPVSQWVGGIFYEHTHRLLASLVGLLSAILAIWVWGRGTSGAKKWTGLAWVILGLGLIGVRTQTMFIGLAGASCLVVMICGWQLLHGPRQLHWWCLLAYSLVLIQGTLGGLRVTLIKDELGIVHGTIAQLFFLLICGIALVTGKRWRTLSGFKPDTAYVSLRRIYLLVSILILGQLILGATMRHQHAGLAVPDFPLAYGKLLPSLDPNFIAEVNQRRMDPREFNPITAGQIVLHMSHRALALIIFSGVVYCALVTRRRTGSDSVFSRLGDFWLGLVCLQAILGAATVWSNKSVEFATLHVVVGALSLGFGGLLTMVSHRVSQLTCATEEPGSASTCESRLTIAPNPC